MTQTYFKIVAQTPRAHRRTIIRRTAIRAAEAFAFVFAILAPSGLGGVLTELHRFFY